jgi:hypothetical protein
VVLVVLVIAGVSFQFVARIVKFVARIVIAGIALPNVLPASKSFRELRVAISHLVYENSSTKGERWGVACIVFSAGPRYIPHEEICVCPLYFPCDGHTQMFRIGANLRFWLNDFVCVDCAFTVQLLYIQCICRFFRWIDITSFMR